MQPVVGKGERRPARQVLLEAGLAGEGRKRPAQRPEVPAPGEPHRQVERHQRERGPERDRDAEQEAQRVDALTAHAAARTRALRGALGALAYLPDVLADEGDALERPDGAPGVPERVPGDDDRVAELAERAYLAGDENADHDPADRPEEDRGVEEAARRRTGRPREDEGHGTELPVRKTRHTRGNPAAAQPTGRGQTTAGGAVAGPP